MRHLALLPMLRPDCWFLAMAVVSVALLSACGDDEVVEPPVVVSVVVTAESDTLFSAGETTQLSATARDASGNVMAIESFTWTSSDEAVVTVNTSGLATAAGPNGSATITASTRGIEGTTAIDVVTGPQGGTVIAAGGKVVLEIPAGAVSQPLMIIVEPVTSYPHSERVLEGAVFNFRPEGTQFDIPVALSIRYDEARIPTGFTEEELRLQRLTEDTWLNVPGSTVDPGANTVRGSIVRFSTYAASASNPTATDGSVKIEATRSPIKLNIKGVDYTVYLGEATWLGPKGKEPAVTMMCGRGGVVCSPTPSGPTFFIGKDSTYKWLDTATGPAFTDAFCSYGSGKTSVSTTILAHELGHVVQMVNNRPKPKNEQELNDNWEPQAHCIGAQIVSKCNLTSDTDAAIKAALICILGTFRFDPNSPPCHSCGDVHMRTPDGLAYDFQGAGEYLFVASADGNVVVQVRQEPWGSSNVVSVNTAVAMNVNGDRVGVYLGRSPELYVNGQPTEMADVTLDLENGGRIYRLDRSSRIDYVVEWPNGFLTSAKLSRSYMDVGVSKPEELQAAFEGLVGNLNGQATDDLRTRQGIMLGAPVLFDELYRSFGDSWRVSAAESLFDYEPGTSTETFQLLDFPRGPVSTADFDQTAVDAARQICEAAGIVDPILLEDCILDLVATGEDEFVESALDSELPATTVEVVEVGNGGFDLNAEGWFWENIDFQGGWRSTGGNPGGNFIINQAGELATDPKLCQVVEGLAVGQSYRITGDYASFAPRFGDPAKPDAFAVTLDGAVILELPRPTPVSTDWTAFSTDLITGTEDPTVCFVAERDGDDSSFRVDNIALRAAID